MEAGVSRSYEIISAHGTKGTPAQRLLAYTTKQRRGPPGLLDALLARDPRIARRLHQQLGASL